MTRLKVGVVGAGRVGAVLGAALHAAGHDVVAAAGESDASLRRMAELTEFNPVPTGKNSLAHAMRWWWALQSWLSPVAHEL